jgi:hypothetical protein
MEELLKSFWSFMATIVEGAAALLIVLGAIEAFAMSIYYFRAPTPEKMSDLDALCDMVAARPRIRTRRRCDPNRHCSNLVGDWPTGGNRCDPNLSQLLSR